jgi:hypothetical protein
MNQSTHNWTGVCALAAAAVACVLAAAPCRAADSDGGDAAPGALKTIYVYRDGCRCAVQVPADTEFYEVECKDIWQGNREVLNDSSPCQQQPRRGYIGGTVTKNDKDSPEAEHYGRAGSGPFVSDFYSQKQLSPASWQEIEGGYFDPLAWNVRLDQSTTRLNFDATAFARSGYVYGIDPLGAVNRAQRNRRFYDATLRFGSMDGGTWRINQTYYETGIGPEVPQAHDARNWRTEAGFRQVECGWLLDSTLYYGKYSSESQLIDNKYGGWRGAAQRQFDSKLSASADADVTRIDVGLDNKTVMRSNAGGQLDWEAGRDLTASGEVRRVDEANDVVITSHLKGYTDVGGGATYHPNSRVNVTADYRHRDVDAERIKLDDPAAILAYLGTPPTQRSDLDSVRVGTSASGDFVNVRGRFRLDDQWALGADYSSVDWNRLPDASSFDNGAPSTDPPYFQNARVNTALRLSREFCNGGQLVLDGGTLHRGNGARTSSFDVRRYSAAYSAPLNACQRYNVGLSRRENSVDLAGTAQDWDDSAWNFDLGFSGDKPWASYSVDYTREMVSGAWAGDYNSVGLDLRFHNSPLAVSAWWRQRQDDLLTFAHYDDLGLRLGYTIPLD